MQSKPKPIDLLLDELQAVRNKIEDLQSKCPHKDKTKINAWSDDDSYSDMEVTYYYSYKCNDCCEVWSEEQ